MRRTGKTENSKGASQRTGNVPGIVFSFSPLTHSLEAAAGLIDPGPSRPPYTDAPADMIAGGEETGRRWAQLEREYRDTR